MQDLALGAIVVDDQDRDLGEIGPLGRSRRVGPRLELRSEAEDAALAELALDCDLAAEMSARVASVVSKVQALTELIKAKAKSQAE